MVGSIHLSENQEIILPATMKSNWVYILMWLIKDYELTNKVNRAMKNATRGLMMRVLKILEAVTEFRLDLQIKRFLI